MFRVECKQSLEYRTLDSITGHSDYLTGGSLHVVVLKDGRNNTNMKRYNRDAAKCTLARNLPAHPEVATRRSVANPYYRPNPTLFPVKKHNRVLTEVLRLNRLAKSHRETNKLCKDMNHNRNRNQPIVTKGKYLPISSKESCLDGEGLQENHKISRPKQEVQERKQIGDLGWLQEYEQSLPLQTEIRMEDSLPVQIVGHSHLNHSEVTVQNKHLSNIEPTQTDGPHVNWVHEFEVDKLVQEQTHNVEEPNMSVPETSSSSRNFNSPINDDNVDTVEHNIDSIDDSRENICVEQNKVITLSNMPSLQKLYSNVRHSSTPPGEKKRTTVHVQFHESLNTAITDVTGDGSDPDQVLHEAAQQLQTMLGAIVEKDALRGNEDGLGDLDSENEDFPTTSWLDSGSRRHARSLDRSVSLPPEHNVRDNGKLSCSSSQSQEVGVLGKEVHETARGYLSDTSTSLREPLSTFMNRLDVMPPTPRYIKQDALTDDEDSIQLRTRYHEEMAGSPAEPAPQASESLIDVVQHRQRSASYGEDIETGITMSRSREEQVEKISRDIDATNAADVDLGEEEAMSRTSSLHLRLSLSESDGDAYISSPERIESSDGEDIETGITMSRSREEQVEKISRDIDATNAADVDLGEEEAMSRTSSLHLRLSLSESDGDAYISSPERIERNDAQNKQASQHHVVEITHPAPRGSFYSEKERRNIVAYIVQQKAYKLLKGKKFWEDMEFDRVCPGRTWQSLKEHFHKSVTRCIRKYVTAEELIKFTKGYSRSRRSEELMGHRANYYTKKENQTLIACMLKYRRYKYVGGNSVWRRLEAKEILPGRTWQSLRNHYRKVLVHNLNGMDVTEAEAVALRTYCPALPIRFN